MVKRELMSEGEGLFKSIGFGMDTRPVVKEHTLGSDFGILNGVTMESTVQQPAFSAFSVGNDPVGKAMADQVINEAQKGVKMMLDDGDIIFTGDNQAPELKEIFREDGTAAKAYVTTDENGNRELHRIPMAVCDFSGGHDHSHEHGHHHH